MMVKISAGTGFLKRIVSQKSCAYAGVVYPMSGGLNKGTGRRIKMIGPLTGWRLDLQGSEPAVRLASASHPASA